MKLYNAIIFFDPVTGIKPRKYRNISNMSNFLKFAQKSGGLYVNTYLAINKKFDGRKSLTGPL